MSSVPYRPPELCTKTRDILAGIDRPDKIHPATITDVVGVFADIKPASVIDGRAIPDKELVGFGLPCIPFSLGYGRDGFALSKDPEIAEAMIDSLRESSYVKDTTGQTDTALERKIGMMLGYPKTAITYYLSREHRIKLNNKSIYENDIEIDTLAFCNLVLSRKHWREEIAAYVKPIAESVKLYTPNTYRVMLSNAAGAKAMHAAALSDVF